MSAKSAAAFTGLALTELGVDEDENHYAKISGYKAGIQRIAALFLQQVDVVAADEIARLRDFIADFAAYDFDVISGHNMRDGSGQSDIDDMTPLDPVLAWQDDARAVLNTQPAPAGGKEGYEMTTLTQTVKELADFRKAFADHTEKAAAETKRLSGEIQHRIQFLHLAEAGLDQEKIALARTVLRIQGTYARAGDERASVIADAIYQLGTGNPVRQYYGDLWTLNFGTKNYDRWHGQRCDCEDGMGPRHGSVIFSVGLSRDVRKRDPQKLTSEETEAAIYLLVRLEAVQSAEAKVDAA